MKGMARTSVLVLLSVAMTSVVADDLQDSLIAVQKADSSSAAIQAKIDDLDDQTRERLDETRRLLARAEQLELYNRQMETIISNQATELNSLDAQIATIEDTEQGILPLMQQMLSQLEKDISSGLPFLIQERESRVALLGDTLGRADVTVSEKFRRVLEALQIEVDYGRTLERYRAREDGTAFDYLRVGNMALYRRSLDGSDAAIWLDGQWQQLGSEHYRTLETAARVAEQTLAPQLIQLPLPAPISKSEGEAVDQPGGAE